MCSFLVKTKFKGDLRGFVGEQVKNWITHWFSLHRDGLVPMRAAFDPTKVPHLLPFVTIYDLSVPETANLRLVGTDVVQSLGFDPTGQCYLDIISPERRQSAYQGLLLPATHPCGMRVFVKNKFSGGREVLVETVCFPFERDDRSGRQLIFVGQEVDKSDAKLRHQNLDIDDIDLIDRTFIDIGAGVPD